MILFSNKSFLKVLLVYVSLLLTTDLQAKSDLIIYYSNAAADLPLGDKIYILEDPESKLQIKDVVNNGKFVSNLTAVPNMGFSHSTFWLMFTVCNKTSQPFCLLEIENPILDEVVLYSPTTADNYHVTKLGEIHHYDNHREYDHPNNIFKLLLAPGETKTYYLKVKTTEQLQIPIKLTSEKLLLKSISHKDTIVGIYIGLILVMFFYNLFLFFTIQDRNYLYYIFYIITVGLSQVSLLGYTFKFLWPESTWLVVNSNFILPSISGIAIITFVMCFLKLQEHGSFLVRIFQVYLVLYVTAIIASVLNYYTASIYIINIVALLGSLSLLIVSAYLTYKGSREAKHFLVAWAIFLIGIFLFVLKNIGVLPQNNFTSFTMLAGSGIEVILISFALGDRINILRKEKEDSQRIAFQEVSNAKRILDLKNEELQKTNDELNRFVYSASHDLKAPIVTIKGLLNVAKMEGASKDPEQYFCMINTSVTQMEVYVKNIVNYYQNSRVEDFYTEIDFTKIISEALYSHQNYAYSKDIKYDICVECNEVFLSDEFRIKLILDNIISNAIKYQKEQEENKRIRIEVKIVEGLATIEVEDNGVGIDESYLNDIYKMFFRARVENSGSGIGLYIAKEAAAKLNGYIHASSKLGSGSMFTILIPTKSKVEIP